MSGYSKRGGTEMNLEKMTQKIQSTLLLEASDLPGPLDCAVVSVG